MRWPVDKWENWYDAQPFGKKTSYCYHDGSDLNLKSGGDSDLGQPIYAIADGEVTSVHSHIGKPTFGNHVHIRHDGTFGSVYCHYAHCDFIPLKIGDRVKEGQKVATLGKTGTDFAHLHWAIKVEPTGVDGIAKTLDDLKKWIDPIKFVKENMANDQTTIQITKADFERLRTGSESYDKTVIYLEIPTTDPTLTPFERVQDVVAGLKSRATDLTKQVAYWETEAKNREEQVGRLKDELLRNEELRNELVIKLTKSLEIANAFEARRKAFQEQVDGMGRKIGELNQTISELKSGSISHNQILWAIKLIVQKIKEWFKRK